VKIFCTVILALGIVACGNSKNDLDGFKDVKFGMTISQIVAMGAKDYMNSNTDCDASSKQCTLNSNGRTLFGKPVKYLSVDMANGAVVNIRVAADFTPREFIALADKEFGSSKSYRYKSFVGNSIDVKFWPIGSTTSLLIKFQEKDLDGSRGAGIFGNIEEDKTVTVAYQGKLATADAFDEYKKTGVVKSKDY
jgi:hypothetical protein